MRPKPDHLGPEYGAQFADASIAAAYGCRPPYPAAVIDLLAALILGSTANKVRHVVEVPVLLVRAARD